METECSGPGPGAFSFISFHSDYYSLVTSYFLSILILLRSSSGPPASKRNRNHGRRRSNGNHECVNSQQPSKYAGEQGDLVGAEKMQLEALALKIKATGLDSIEVALTKNALGELYLDMNKLDEAQKMLEDAEAIRSSEIIHFPVFCRALLRDGLFSRDHFLNVGF
jgi:hypothetical protein